MRGQIPRGAGPAEALEILRIGFERYDSEIGPGLGTAPTVKPDVRADVPKAASVRIWQSREKSNECLPDAVFLMFRIGNQRCVRDQAQIDRPRQKRRAPSNHGIESSSDRAEKGTLAQSVKRMNAAKRFGEIHPGTAGVLGPRTRHGLPAAVTSGGMSLVTTEQAPITLRAPISTPGMMNARAPMNASAPMVIFAVTSWSAGCEKSWLPVLR